MSEDKGKKYGSRYEYNPYSNQYEWVNYSEPTQISDRKKIVSDGGSTSYYDLPEGAKDINDIMSFKEMGFARGNIFKAVYRMGEKEGVPVQYDINKIRHFCDVLEKAVKQGYRV